MKKIWNSWFEILVSFLVGGILSCRVVSCHVVSSRVFFVSFIGFIRSLVRYMGRRTGKGDGWIRALPRGD
jgi:hypothetical protein